MKNYYTILSISPSATRQEIVRAYRQAALKYHPDLSNELKSTDRFREITEAYQILINPVLRSEYNRKISQPDTRSVLPEPSSSEKILTRVNSCLAPFRSKLRSFFGEVDRSLDVHSHLKISPEIARLGGVQEFTFECIDEIDGKVFKDSRKLKIKIPAGIAANQKIRLKGLGAASSDQSRFGDLYLKVDY